MIRRSMRWRLSLSYAAIALFAALALGVTLLLTLRSYYRQREQSYLQGNARTISIVVAQLLDFQLPSTALQEQLTSFSFLAQTRIKLLDPDGQVMADSGLPKQRRVSFFSSAPQGDVLVEKRIRVTTPGDERELEQAVIIITGDPLQPGAGIAAPVLRLKQELTFEERVGYVSIMPAVGTFYGFGLDAEVSEGGVRSDQVVRWPVTGESGEAKGYIVLSDGPAYGQEVLSSVAWGWAISGSVAVLLAAAVGWWVSRSMSQPLCALTAVTARMAEGDMAARANVARGDEFGLLARSFNQMAGQLEQTIVALRRFVADAAHELHTPLTAMRTNLELALSSPEHTECLAFTQRAQEQVLRLQMLSTDLLDLSRLEARQTPQEHLLLDWVALVRTACEPYASRAEQLGLLFSLELPSEPLPIRGNATQLLRALNNLLDNAAKFTPAGGTVRLCLRRDGHWATLEVEDNGIGIPAADLPQLFNRFHRGQNASAFPGSGLGLTIVRAIVEGHGGQVAAHNLVPQGACFTLHLPLDLPTL